MAFYRNRKPSLGERKADRAAVLAIRTMADYTPVNPAYSAEALIALEQALLKAEQEELWLQNALAGARDTAAAAAWALHDGILGAKFQVIAQYGADSNAVQAVGLKKKSDRRRPTRRNGTNAS
jgi:hypothetical protein